MDLLQAYEGFFFDMDGVLYLGNTPIPGALETMRRLLEHKKRVALVTNNSGQSERSIRERLARLGFPADDLHVVAASTVTARWLGKRYPGAAAYVLGSRELREELRRAGLVLCDDSAAKCDVLVVGNDRRADYGRLATAIRLGRAGALFVAVNRDRLFPVESGLFPGAAALVAAVEAGLERPVDVLIGKPSPYLLHEAVERTGLTSGKCLMVGDTLDQDVAMGQAAGIDTALVLTGVDSLATLQNAPVRPTYVLNSVADLLAG